MPVTELRERLRAALAAPGVDSSDYDLNPETKLPPDRKLRPAAVLMAVTEQKELILTKRSPRLRHHPGQIAFPGGRQDPEDATLADAALRESEEEIALPRDRVELLGHLPPHETVTGFEVTPFVGLVRDFEPRPELGEVAEIFRVPLGLVLDPANYRIESRHWKGGRRYYYVVPWGPYYIWGATARMLRALAGRMT